MARPIDLPRARRALAALDRIAAEHPELRHQGQPWANHLNQLRELVMTPEQERIAKYRAKQRQKGLKAINAYLTSNAQEALRLLQSERPEATMGDIISDALIRAVVTTREPHKDRE